MEQESSLRRSIGFYALLFYGVGTMVGGGFYALLGKVAGEAGVYLPVALGVAGLIALVNSCAFSELSSRFPVSAGESRYVLEGFKLSWLSQLTGWMIVTTGVVSAATLAVAITGFLRDLVAVPETISLLITVALLGGIAAWGVAESVAVVVVITVIEVSALIFIIVVNSGNLIDLPTVWQATGDNSSPSTIMGIFTGAFLTFYAFIGFEDMVNMAEEVKEPERNLALAIPLSVLITTIIYILVGVVAIASVPVERLLNSATPMAELVGSSGTIWIGLISMLTGVNGALVQLVMAARVSYGMTKQGHAPTWLGRVNAFTQTPLTATVLLTLITAVLALYFPLTTLAKATSFVILMVFALVNLALWKLKEHDPDWAGSGPRYPRWAPLFGAALCLAALVFQTIVLLRS